ncbi:cupin [filamentous cyanobacterium CCP5]|nr:cupin [filamentous cyanobacterium CCP5]
MENYNWLVTDQGEYRTIGDPEVAEPEKIYRLYRFLTDLDDVLDTYGNDEQRLEAIFPLVRKLLISSYWLQMEYDPPSEKTGWSVKFLYREHQYPLTVQMVCWRPGTQSTIHNHATWGIVALIGGQERNRLWQRSPTPESPDRIEPRNEIILNPGDVIGFTGGAIHSVEPVGDEPPVSFNLYGITDRRRRYQYDIEHQTAKKF